MKSNIKWFILIAVSLVSLTVASCSDKGKDTPEDKFDVSIVLPASADMTPGRQYVFSVKDKKAPLTTDQMIFQSVETQVMTPATITAADETSVSVTVPSKLVSGEYGISVRRGNERKLQGNLIVNIVKHYDGPLPDASSNVWGLVMCGDQPVKGAVVSDGVEVVTTDDKGMYQFKSEKYWGYVFLSVPSGYEVHCKGVLPQLHRTLVSGKDVQERVDFELVKKDQTNYTLLMFGDIHLAARNDDEGQFENFMRDVTNYMDSHKGTTYYAITLGDMTWDLYWYDNNFQFPEYLKAINGGLEGLQVFHTMGNHDNDMETTSHFDAKFKYIRNIAPSFYSFNIGQIHYVVVDDINCSKYDGTKSRNYYCDITEDQLQWLEKDLQHVDKSTPIILTTHAQFFDPQTVNSFGYHKASEQKKSTDALMQVLKGRKVQFITGHSHMMYNVTPSIMPGAGGSDFSEHNGAAVCASWWWSNKLTSGAHVCQDGTPGGYGIWTITGKTMSHVYKGTGKNVDYQFRTYDLNNVHFSEKDVPELYKNPNSKARDHWVAKYENAYPVNTKAAYVNTVLINVWDWSPEWTLSVTDEKGQKLDVKSANGGMFDPYHIAALTVKRFNKSDITSLPSFYTVPTHHMFTVKCPDADTDLTITATDPYGHTYVQEMTRPKAFSLDVYNREGI